MDEHASILLVKILDRLRFGIQLHCTTDGLREFLVWEIDACILRIERAGDEGAD